MNGFATGASTSDTAWGWKRHAGLDVVTYTGDGVNGRSIAHSMNDVPEMMIVKRRSSTEDWTVYHTGLTSVNYHLTLNSNGAEVDMSSTPEKVWKSAPTATYFEIGSHDRVNTDGEDYLALLFSSIDGISKVGSYTGNGSSTGPVISLGFTPRFILFKNASSGGNGWAVLDTVRGLGTSSQKRIWMDGDWAQDSGNNYVTTTSTSFQPVMNNTEFNENNSTIIYYAHA